MDNTGKNYEALIGIAIAIFAAFMAISDLFAGKFGDDEIILTNEKAAAYSWYQSKSIKESLAEGQRDLLQKLIEFGAIERKAQAGAQAQVQALSVKVVKYSKEKNEILLGSLAVGKENWVQEKDGQLGQIIGAKDFETNLEKLSRAGDRFDLASLFYQICLVMGALSLVTQADRTKKAFFGLMIGLGLIGFGCSVAAFLVVF